MTNLNKNILLFQLNLLNLNMYIIPYNLENEIIYPYIEVCELYIFSYFISKDLVKNINMSDDKLIQGILHQSTPYRGSTIMY
jgi:hypothetical protein